MERKQNHRNVEPHRPHMVQVYNDYKGGVDIADAGANRYLYKQRHKRWTKSAILFFFKITVCNAWRIYESLHPDKKITQRDFIEILCKQILEKYGKKHKQKAH